ncbi:hypothetical protein AAFF_G00385810 [Aldrovandia affinis]|uniref:Uncharacterized protein n=1 Tax=Aldrovandia affinis TaxID=143900 RepID=A0AAD7SF62_9TELE|nr:hypothetical protein AAFF_G00385810 [Aldrovandia affinis]
MSPSEAPPALAVCPTVSSGAASSRPLHAGMPLSSPGLALLPLAVGRHARFSVSVLSPLARQNTLRLRAFAKVPFPTVFWRTAARFRKASH